MSWQDTLGTVLLALAAASGGSSAHDAVEAEEFGNLRQIVRYHLQTYPAMEIQDLYKLSFQAAMGSEHVVEDHATARRWLEREVSALAGDSLEPLSEPLSPDGALVRIHLRPFFQKGGDLDDLVDAFVETAVRFDGSNERLQAYWQLVEAMAEAGEIPFARQKLADFFAGMRDRGYPAVRHSSTYRNRYRPAYRVVLLRLLGSSEPAITGD